MKNKLKKLSVNNLTLLIIIGQVLVYLSINSGLLTYNQLAINYNLIEKGEIWRVISFIFIPPSTSPIWALLNWYILYLMGSNLEHYWGAIHYNLYILVAVILTNLAAKFFYLSVGTNYYFQSSIFLAFAFINPNFQVRLFFILPIKIKWIALFTGLLYLRSFILGITGERILLIASLANFFIFFSKDIYYKIKYRGKTIKTKVEKKIVKQKPHHTCQVCGKNNLDYPYMDFRYCGTCTPEKCYCEEHLENHTHYGE